MSATPSLRVLTWNILEGWHDLRADPPVFCQERAELARRLITHLNPDIVVLNEALWSRPVDGKFMDYAAWLGFPHSMVDTYDGPWGNAILSRHPFSTTHRFRIYNRGGLRVQVRAPAGVMGVATYHPHPSRYSAHKAQDFQKLLDIVPQDAWVVTGDFNALSPADETDEVSLVQEFSQFSKQPAADAARFTDGGRQVFAALTAAGFADAFPPSARQPTMPTALVGASNRGMRIDHAWITASVKVMGAEVVRHPWADEASDHYPLCLDLGWKS